VSGIANVTSPPYDVISGGSLAHLRAADPHNVVRLILPGTGPDAPKAAAALLAEWMSDGVLIRDRMPSLYLYEQQNGSGRQRGIIGLVGLGTPDSAGILPHENVMPGPVAGRRQLMAATEANLEPIFLVYDGTQPGNGLTATQVTDEVAETQTPLLSMRTEDGVTHKLWRLADPAGLEAIAADLACRRALIADGHHRYAAYLELQAEMQALGRGAGPWDYGLAFLVDSAASPPRLGAIHRVLPGLAPACAAKLARAAFTVQELPPGTDQATALARLSRAGQAGNAFLLTGGAAAAGGGAAAPGGGARHDPAGDQAWYLLSCPDPVQVAAAMPPGASPHWRGLDASVMQQLLLARLWGITDNEQDVLISHYADEAVSQAAETGGTAVLLNPVPFDAVREIAEQGEQVPRKSTSFGPKPRTGLVLRTFGPRERPPA